MTDADQLAGWRSALASVGLRQELTASGTTTFVGPSVEGLWEFPVAPEREVLCLDLPYAFPSDLAFGSADPGLGGTGLRTGDAVFDQAVSLAGDATRLLSMMTAPGRAEIRDAVGRGVRLAGGELVDDRTSRSPTLAP